MSGQIRLKTQNSEMVTNRFNFVCQVFSCAAHSYHGINDGATRGFLHTLLGKHEIRQVSEVEPQYRE
jgi:hypothetical protein